MLLRGFDPRTRKGHESCVSALPAERGMDELDPVPITNRDGLEILSVHESAVDLHDHRGIVFFGSVQQILNRQLAAFDLLGKSIEHEFHG